MMESKVMRNFKDMRLSASSSHALDAGDLQQPHLFSVKAVLTHNPGMRELLKLSNVERRDVAAGSGAFLPGLLSKQLHMCPVLLFQSPSLTEEAAIHLTETCPVVFSEPTSSGRPSATYIGWPIKPSTLCVHDYQLMNVLENGCAQGFVIIVAISGDTLSIGAFNSVGLVHTINEKSHVPVALRKRVLPAEPSCGDDLADDINFGEVGSESRCIGPDGRHANIMRIEPVNDNALHVPTREVVAWPIREDDDNQLTAFSELVEDPNGRNRPVVAFGRGSHVGRLVPTSCHSFPLLAVYLPNDMHAAASRLALGEFTSTNLISEDLTRSTTNLVFNDEELSLNLSFSDSLNNLVAAVEQAQELIIAVRCGPTMWLRYYSDNRDWLEQFWLTKMVADNYKPRSMFTAEQISAAEARIDARRDAEYENWLHNESGLGDDTWIPRDIPGIDTTPPTDHDMNREKVWFLGLYELQPYILGDRDLSF
jgi:hypothetical protein